jgi:hypothetical protein
VSALRTAWPAALALGLAMLLPAAAPAAPVVGAQARYWSFSNDNDLRDALVYVAPGPFHVQLEYWDFERGQDQFRPEIGLHLRDRRRSVTTVQWRHERGAERFWLGTEQVVDRHWVARAEVSPIVEGSRTTTVVDAGADVYWGSYDFAGITVIRDPREDGLWVVPARLRLASERNDWVQLALAPASRRTLGWAADLKWKVLRAGVERNSRFDFTRLDNVIFTLGLERPLGPARP